MKDMSLKGILLNQRRDITRGIENCVRENFDGDVILTGIKDESKEDSLCRNFTYGIPLGELGNENGQDILDYAHNLIIVYDRENLLQTPNGDYEVTSPVEAILGYIELSY